MLLHPWDFPGKSTGVRCHFPLQRIFPTQGSNPGLLHCRQILYWLSLVSLWKRFQRYPQPLSPHEDTMKSLWSRKDPQPVRLASWSWTSRLQNMRNQLFLLFISSPVCGILLWQPGYTKTRKILNGHFFFLLLFEVVLFWGVFFSFCMFRKD